MVEQELLKTPMRKCIESGELLPKEKMIRFVISPEGEIVPDLHHKLPGRGIWVTAYRKNITSAFQKRLFQKHFEGMIKPDIGIIDRLVHLIEVHLLGLLGLIRKQGKIIAGFEKLVSGIKKGQIALVLKANDASAPDFPKLQRLNPELPVVDCFTKEKLGQIFGEAQFVYIGVQNCGLLPVFLEYLQKLKHLAPTP